ncbi:MAG: signal peptide peptidase SppA [Planctomycetes bacterium]|nr:signal peptide peptidase SppA [Planctomycetota bacterium]
MRTPFFTLFPLFLLATPSTHLLAQDPPAAEAKAPEAAAPPEAKTTDPAAPAAPEKAKVPFLKPRGAYADLAESGFSPMSLLTGGGAPPKSFYALIELIDGLVKRPETEVVLDLSAGVGFNLPQLRELERAITRVRGAGKQITCYVENAGQAAYQVAALCDRILMADMGSLDLRSPALTVMHYKDALDLLGVQVEVTRVGAFKGAVEPYLLPTISDHLRQHYEAMLKSMNDDVVRRIAAGRKLSPDAVRKLQAQRLLTAKDALVAGLVDRLVPWAGAERAIATMRGDDAFELVDAAPKKRNQNRDFMSMLSSMFRPKKEEEIEDPELVVMHLAGEIVDGDNASPGSMVSGPVVKKLDELAANELVKGVVVRINSPGGSATASEAIRQALQRLAAVKPVVFSMGELAASGGYWITTIGQPILAEAGTITGSIGVFGMRFQLGALMRRIGVHTDVVRLDDGPLMDAMDRPWSDAARERMQGSVDEIYARFLANVAGSRHKTVEQVDNIAGGRVWSGQQAVDNGLVDRIGGLDDALAMVREQAKVGADVEVRHLPEGRNFADSFLSSMFDAHAQLGGDADLLRAVAAQFGPYGELLGMLREAFTSRGAAKVYALMPPGLRVE